MEHCPICDGNIEKNVEGYEECELCGTIYKKTTQEKVQKIISDYYAKISKEVWGR